LAGPDTPGGATSKVDNGSDDNERARALYREALAAHKAQHYEEARKMLLQVWAIRQTYDVASALAQPEMKLKLYRDAATHLQFCLDNFAPVSSKQKLQTIKEMMAEAKAQVGTLHIKTNREGAEVQVDGRAIGVSPLKAPVYVEPGQHEVTLVQGNDRANEPIEVEAGKDINVEVPLETKASPPAPSGPAAAASTPPTNANPSSPPPVPAVPPEEPHRSIVPVIIGGAVFAVGLGTGIGLRLAASSKHNTVDTLNTRVGPGGCVNASASQQDCASLLSAAQSYDRYVNWSTASFAVAGTALVAASIYWLWPRSSAGNESTKAGALRINGSIGSKSTSLMVAGDF
jgi:hypothetical protein